MMDMIRHLNQFQYLDMIASGRSTKNGKENQMVPYGVKQDTMVRRSLIAMIKNCFFKLASFHNRHNYP